jgi:hypothetical protein
MAYLTMLSAPQTTHYQMVDWYMNNELESMWKEATMALLEIYSSVCLEELRKAT